MAADSKRDRIIDCSVELAEQSSWEAVRLHNIAARLNISLDDIRAHFREKEEITDAFFDRADRAMLACSRAWHRPINRATHGTIRCLRPIAVLLATPR